MERYAPSIASDTLILQWWAEMERTGDAEAIFHAAAHAPSDILRVVQPPTAFFYERDDRGLTFAIWFEPWMGCGVTNIWAREDHRPPPLLERAGEAFVTAFEETPVLLCISDDARIARFWKRYGFTVTQKIPYLFQGHDAFVGHLTREAFYERHGGQLSCQTTAPNHA